MKKDVFKSLGIRVGNAPDSLLQTVSNTEINKGFDSMENSRVGQGPSARDMLEYSLGLKKSIEPIQTENNDINGTLEDNHAESFHDDNDKTVENLVSTTHEAGEQVKRKDAVDETRKPGRSEDHNRYILEMEADGSMSVIERSKNDTNFMKAMGWLNSPSKKDDKKEAKEQKKELDDISKKSELDSLVDLIKGAPKGVDADKHERCVKEIKAQGKDIGSAYAICTSSMKGKTKKGFVRASGPGGMLFDFGKSTGNPIADNFTSALNICPEPQQEQILRSQQIDYEKALEKFVTKGEREFNKDHQTVTEDGSVHPEMEKALAGSFDEQTAKAIQDGHIRIVEGFVPPQNKVNKSSPSSPSTPNMANGGELNTSNEGPAVINQYNSEEIILGGEVIKATSETDMALLQQMKKSGLDQRDDMSGIVIDTSMGGARSVIIDAVSGEVLE